VPELVKTVKKKKVEEKKDDKDLIASACLGK
jgi:hypothetical protein